MAGNFHSFPCKEERMEYITTALVAGTFTLIFLFLYKYVINPTIVYTPNLDNMSKCPDRWNFDPITGKCAPGYKTSCLPFDPEDSTLNTLTARCNLARNCQTSWSGFCG